MRSFEELIVLTIVMFFIILCSLIGNLMVLIAFKASKVLRKNHSNFLILNLATSDFLSAGLLMPFQLVIVIQPSLVIHGGILCSLAGVLSYPFFIVSSFSLVMLSFERYVALGYPLHHLSKITPRFIGTMVIYPWVHALCYATFTGLAIDIKFDPKSLDCGLGWRERHIAFVLFTALVHVVFPFVALVTLNTRTLLLVRNQGRRTRLHLQASQGNIVANRRKGRRQIKNRFRDYVTILQVLGREFVGLIFRARSFGPIPE